MAAYIKTLKNASRENIIYPRTKSEAVYRNDNTTSVEDTLVALEAEIASISGSTSDISGVYETKADAQAKLDAAKVYTDEQIAAIPTPDISGQIEAHNKNTSAHADIRAAIDSLGSEIDGKLSGKADATHSHNDLYYTEAEVDALIAGIDTSIYETKTDASSKLAEAKAYADSAANTVKQELSGLISDNADAIDTLEDVVATKADAEHNHDDRYYTKAEFDAFELITVDEIDGICGATIQVASLNEVTF